MPALAYATPWPRRKYVPSPEANRLFWMAVRKVVFAGGIGLLMWGFACLAAGVEPHAGPFAIAWGATFIVLMLPFSLRPRHPARRNRRRRRVDSLNHEATKHTKRALQSRATSRRTAL